MIYVKRALKSCLSVAYFIENGAINVNIVLFTREARETSQQANDSRACSGAAPGVALRRALLSTVRAS